MKRVSPSLLFVLVLIWIAASGFAADVLEISLQQAVERALQNHPILQGHEGQIGVREAKVVQARSGYFPQVTAVGQGKLGLSGTTGGLGLQGLVTSPFYRNLASSVHIYQNLFDFGRTDSATQSARYLKMAAEHELDAARNWVALEAREAYLKALENQTLIRLDERILEQRRLQYRKVEALYRSGLRSKLDSSQAEYQVREAEAGYAEHQQLLKRTLARLNRAMGQNAAQPYQLKEVAVETAVPVQTEESVEQALKNRPDLRSLELQIQAVRERVELARKQRYPSFGAIWSGGFARFTEYSLRRLMVGAFGFGLPIFTGKRLEASIQEQEQYIRILESDLEDLKQSIRLYVSEAISDLARYQAVLPVLNEQIEVARELLGLANARYQAGLTSFLDVLAAQAAYADAQVGHEQALYNYKSAEFRLLFGIGLK